MTRQQILELTGITQNSLANLTRKGKAAHSGKVIIPGVAVVLEVKKSGSGKFDKVEYELSLERTNRDPEERGLLDIQEFPSEAELASLPKSELERFKLLAETLKIRLATEEAEMSMRRRLLKDLTSSLLDIFADFRAGVARLKLPANSLQQIRQLLDRLVSRLADDPAE